ncbi:MAG: hypothetical protein FJX80_07300 [Bacteroidetes bacterium]|nr:hypothetical protein [Bacteroidota bacterium]
MKKVSLILSAVIISAMMLSSCGGGASKEVTIGKQVWMTQNLNVDKFRNGDPIPEAKTKEEWARAGENKQPAWCYYENDPANGAKYGKLYNWYAVNDPRGLAPEGWHIPSDGEWSELSPYLGGEYAAGEVNYRQTVDDVGFSDLPSGRRLFDGTFEGIGEYGIWWSKTDGIFSTVWIRDMTNGILYRYTNSKENGFSVRCVRD